jgi:lipopolysaccharide transport system ATP-binding protein
LHNLEVIRRSWPRALRSRLGQWPEARIPPTIARPARALAHASGAVQSTIGSVALAPPPLPEDVEPRTGNPTIIHVTHWKAGSQWIYKVLREIVPERIVAPRVSETQFLSEPIRAGGVYPTAYVTRAQYDTVQLPPDSHRFVIIRDLRDTLISAYFSLKLSHPTIDQSVIEIRHCLHAASMDDGLIFLMNEWLPQSARIQLSWVEAGEPVLRYEDLLGHDVELLERTLIDRCGLPVPREQLRSVVNANRFEALTGGRRRGVEDLTAHERKGVAGDWRLYFTDRVKRAFKARYGGVLVLTGYERGLGW